LEYEKCPSGWWCKNQPLETHMLVKLDHFTQILGENETYLKPPAFFKLAEHFDILIKVFFAETVGILKLEL